MRKLLAAVTAAAALVVFASPAPAETTRSAKTFRKSACVNTHFHYGDTPYADHDQVIAALNRLGTGITIRDGIVTGANQATQIAGWNQAFEDGRHRIVVGLDPRSTPGSLDTLFDPIDEGQIRGLRAIEGPNEYNGVVPDSWRYESPPRPQYVFLQDWMRELVAKADAADLGVPVIDWSPTTWQSAEEADDAATVNGPRPGVDAGNVHSYSAGRNVAPGFANEDSGWHSDLETGRNLYVSAIFGAGFPWVVTETGYHTSREYEGAPIDWHHGVSERVQGAYLVNSLLESFWFQAWDNPRPLTCLYELLDGSCPNCAGPENWPAAWHHQNSFGLFRSDYTPKPAVARIRNLLRIVDRAGTRDTPVEWSYDLQGPDGTPGWHHFRFFGMRDGEGHRLLAIWRPDSLWDRATYTERTHPPKLARFTDGAVHDFEVYQPGTSSAAVHRCRGTVLDWNVAADDATIVRVRRTLARVPPPAC